VEQRILVIEDDASLADFTQWQLESHGYQVRIATRAHDGLKILDEWKPDLVLMDIMMPDMDGWEATQRIRERSDVPLIFTTALGREKDVVRGLEMGADDYVAKPFGPHELLARIRAVLRRHDRGQQPEHMYQNGPLSINLDSYQVFINEQEIALTPREFKLLSLLAHNEGKVITHDVLLNEIWGAGHTQHRHYLKLYIWYLRRKIEADPRHPSLILTERGIGYRLARIGD
jgi:DNA-binding response OmpR family regulator